jgi:hypothetical protein
METAETSNKKPIYKKWWAWVGALVLIVIIVQLTASKETKEQWAKDAAAKEALAHSPAVVLQNDVTYGNTILYDSVKHSVNVFNTQDISWDGYSLINDHFSKAIKFGKKAFADDSTLTEFTFNTKTELKDVNGNLDTAIVLTHTFPRAAFMEVKWDNFKMGDPIYFQIAKTVTKPYMHPAIAKEINADDLSDKIRME